MNLINSQQGIINTWHKELNQRMRVLPVHIKIEGLSESKEELDNACNFYHSNTKTTWSRFKSYIPFTFQNKLKSIYWQRAEIVKDKLTLLQRQIEQAEQQPKPVPRRASEPCLPRVYPSMFTQKPAARKSDSFNHLPRIVI